MKKWFVVIALCVFFAPQVVFAKDIYYTNDHGVSFSKEEYDFLTNLYWDGCQDLLYMADYEKLIDSGYVNCDVKTVSLEEPLPITTEITDQARNLKIGKACDSSTCLVAVTLKWLKSPTIRSYDVMGAYLDDTIIIDNPVTTCSTENSGSFAEDTQKFDNGFGSSIKLASGNSVIVSQSFEVLPMGKVYASYQHAMYNISLADSKKYTISRTGYGSVFEFSGKARDAYDRMNGVSLAMN